MFEYLKNKASAAASYVADKAKAVYAYAAEKTADTIEWYSDMEVTPREKVIATVAGVGAVGAAWAAFSLGFGSSAINLTTLAATPAVTTTVTGIAAGTFMIAKKAIAGGLNLAADGIQVLAATHPDRNANDTFGGKVYRTVARNFGQGTRFDRWFAGEYQPGEENDSDTDYEFESEDEISKDESARLYSDLFEKDSAKYHQPASLFSRGQEKRVKVGSEEWNEENALRIMALPYKTTRSGKTFNSTIEEQQEAPTQAKRRTTRSGGQR